MNGETKRAHLKLTGGTELIPAASAAAEHFAEEAGLDVATRDLLVAACEQVCNDALAQAESNEGALEVIIDQFADRIEIAITHPGVSGPAIGLDSFLGTASGPSGASGASLLNRVDRVRYETVGQCSRMILVKYLPGAKKNAN
ncbi:MAG TPA: hypothetical protein VKG84_06150 [Candidatus Acidoferrales bacterium]|nr:hypothetical protein [Candidatus Acidoferrales bacterium]